MYNVSELAKQILNNTFETPCIPKISQYQLIIFLTYTI